MSGPFDDLIPQGAAKPAGGGTFDDLIPAPKSLKLPAKDAPPAAAGPQDWEPRQFTTGEKVSRKVGLAAQGLNDSLYGMALAPLDVSGWIARKTGLVSPDATPPSRAMTNALASVPGAVGLASPDAPTRIDPAGTGERAAYGIGEGVGNALGVILPAGVVANAARPGVVQGVANVLRTQPMTQIASGAAAGGVGEATQDPLLGLAAGLAVPAAASAIRGAVSPVRPNQLRPQEQRLVAAAQQEGIPLTPAQQTGSPSLRGLEETMARMPFSNGPMQRTFTGQREQFNRAALERAGVAGTDASPPVMEQAFRTAGQAFDDLAARTTLRPDPQFGADVRAVAQNYGRRLDTDVAGVFRSYMDDLEPLLQAIAPGRPGSTLPAVQSGANPQISGEVYQTIRSDMTRRMRESQNNKPLQRALGGLVEALDDVMERSASGALRGEWQEARRQYQALMTIDKAMQGGTQANRSAGDIPFGALSNATKSGDRAGYTRGRGQMNELARIGDYLAPRVPNSGTPERTAWSHLLNGAGLMTGVGIPPYLASRLYNSPAGRAWLTNQLAGQTDWRAALGGATARQGLVEAGGEPNVLRLGGGR